MIRSFIDFNSASVASRSMASEIGEVVDLWFDGQHWVIGHKRTYDAEKLRAAEAAAQVAAGKDPESEVCDETRTGLSPPEWEDGSSNETLYPGSGSYTHSWDSD